MQIQQMNIIVATVLLLFLMYACSVLDRKTNINKIYLLTLTLNLLLILLNITFVFIINIKGLSIIFPRLIGGLIFGIAPLFAYLFLKFICNYFSTQYKIKRSIKALFTFLIFLNFLVAIMTFKSEMFLESRSITECLIPFFISLIFFAYSSIVIFKGRKMLIKFEYLYIFTISIMTIVLVIIQFIVGETKYLWCCSSFGVILMFIIIQQRELYRDTLTGARNRLVLAKCLEACSKKPNENLSVVMIDLDYFKNINDTYGHSEGDYVLKTFVKLLQKVYSEDGIVIRTGGDEFLVLIYHISQLEVNELNKKMSKLVDKYNNRGTKPYRIKYSCACGTYSDRDKSMDQFIHEIDMKMYQNKQNKKGKMWSVESM